MADLRRPRYGAVEAGPAHAGPVRPISGRKAHSAVLRHRSLVLSTLLLVAAAVVGSPVIAAESPTPVASPSATATAVPSPAPSASPSPTASAPAQTTPPGTEAPAPSDAGPAVPDSRQGGHGPQRGEALPPAPDGAEVPSVHAEMHREHGARVYHFEPGERPEIELPDEYRGPTAETEPSIVLASWTSGDDATAGTYALPNELRREVHGFLPYWLLEPENLQYLRYDRLSTIAYFSVDARSNGYLDKAGSGWTGWTSAAMTDVINRAHARGVKVILTVTMMAWDGNTGISTLLNSSTYRARLVQEIVSAVRLRNADGVNIDFEPVASADRDDFTSFVRQLKAGLVNGGVGSYLSVCTTGGAASWSTGYDVARLVAAGAADHLFVMGYDYSWSGSERAGGVAPIESPYMLDVASSLSDYLAQVSGSKIIWGVPYYGRSWPTTSNALNATTRPATATSYSRAWYYTAGLEAAAAHGRKWDATGRLPWFAHWDSANSTWREGYYDDVESLGHKYDLVNRHALAGTGMWHLLMDEERPELWDLLRTKFGDSIPPRVVSASPAASATNVPTAASVQVWFSEPVTGVTANTFVLRNAAGTVVPATVTYSPAKLSATLRPSAPLAPGARYSVALSHSIRDRAWNSLAWTSWTFTTTTSAQTFSPVRKISFRAGEHTGYRFNALGQPTAARTARLTSSSSASTSQRAAIPGHPGTWLYVTNGIWAGYWVEERPASFAPGTVGKTTFDPRTISFRAGTHTGYRFDSAGRVTASKTVSLSRGSSAAATARAIINGRAHLYVANGTWAGYWIAESPSAYLRGFVDRRGFDPRSVAFSSGTHTGYRFDTSGRVTATKTAKLSSSSAASANAQAVINGRRYLYVTNGTWAGYWLPESSSVRLVYRLY